MTVTQQHRPFAIATPLGEDAVMLRAARVSEGISQLFEIECELLSSNTSIKPAELLGKNVTLRMDAGEEQTRYFNGYVAAFAQAMGRGQQTSYRMRVVPWLWFLTRSSDCRIFQDQSVPDIVGAIFRERGFADVSKRLSDDYKPRPYTVQYRETDFNFVSRLLEDEGIAYHFAHANGKHTLVLADSPSAYEPVPGYAEVRFHPRGAGEAAGDAIGSVTFGGQVQSAAFATGDFDFARPGKSLGVRAQHAYDHANGDAELFDFPGDFVEYDAGERIAKRRVEELAAAQESLQGDGDSRGLAAGATFTLADAPDAALERRWMATHVVHELNNDHFHGGGGGPGEATYAVQFSAIDAATPYRPPRSTPRPVVQGPQTAIVCGTGGEELFTDAHGRIKVRFHWDRRSKADETSSCWIRVAQSLAGNKWGALFLPRVGQEVIVEFLEGDPDRPIVTGCVYNGDNTPPYELPANATRSTLKTNSSKGGNGFNELRIEDKKGSEQLFVHGERDADVRVKRDAKQFVGRDAHAIVKRHEHRLTEGDSHTTVKGDRNEKVDGTDSRTIGMDLQQKVGMKHALDAGLEIHLKAGMNVVIEAGMSVTLKAGGGFITVGPAGVAISGTPVLINSGGAAGSGSGASPDAPKPPLEADQAQAGKKSDAPPAARPPKPTTFSAAAVALKQAAAGGAPFCEKCAPP